MANTLKTFVIMYMPGHAGNFILRLFALSDTIMPVLTKQDLSHLVNQKKEISKSFNRLENYKFSKDAKKYPNWQTYHRLWADYIDSSKYRSLNIFCRLKYNFMFAIHPKELETDFFPNESVKNTKFYHTNFYFVDLDTKYNSWVQDEQTKLKFVWRDDEQELFDLYRTQYSMKPISLTKLLGNTNEFSEEYLRVCNEMSITPCLEDALVLNNDWRSIRYTTDNL